MLRPHCLFLLVLFVLCSIGCVTNKTAPSQVGWGDLIGPGRLRLDAHLDTKRYEIEQRELYAGQLDGIIDGYHITLSQLRNDLDDAHLNLSKSKLNYRGVLNDLQKKHGELNTALEHLDGLYYKKDQVPSKALVDAVLKLGDQIEVMEIVLKELPRIEAKYSTQGD